MTGPRRGSWIRVKYPQLPLPSHQAGISPEHVNTAHNYQVFLLIISSRTKYRHPTSQFRLTRQLDTLQECRNWAKIFLLIRSHTYSHPTTAFSCIFCTTFRLFWRTTASTNTQLICHSEAWTEKLFLINGAVASGQREKRPETTGSPQKASLGRLTSASYVHRLTAVIW